MKRVAHVLGPSAGGIRRHVRHLASHPPRGWETAAVCGPRDLASYFAGLPFVVTSRWDYLRRRDADLLHVHGLTPGIVALRPARPPVVLTLHMDLPVQGRTARWPLLRIPARVIVGRADAAVAVSERIGRLFPGSRVVPPAVDPLPFPKRPRQEVRDELRTPRDAVVALALARLHPDKRLDVFVEAVRRSGAVGWLAGRGPDRERLQALARGTPVRFLGHRDDVPDLLAAADVLAMPSRGEGYPIAAVEAITAHRPVVATRVGAIPEIVGDAGLLVDPDDPDAFGRALTDVVADRGLLAGLTECAARRRLPPPETLVSRVGAVYDEVCP